MKKLIFIISFLLIFSKALFAFENINNSNYPNTHASIATIENKEYTYKRIFIDGMWWIYVYDEDGALVNIYPDV